MRDKTVTRCIDFTKEDIQRLNKLALERNEILEDYLAEMIPKYLIPLLESEILSHQSDELTPDELNRISHNHLYSEVDGWNKSKKNYQLIDYGELINGHTSKFLPIVVGVRALLSILLQEDVEAVPYTQYRHETFVTAAKLKKSLIMAEAGDYGFFERGLTDGLPWIAYEDGLSSRGGYSRKTSTPLSTRIDRSKNWFHQYYLNANPNSRKPGIMRILNLVKVSGNGKSAQITLTSLGKELALAGKNPIIDIGLCDRLPGDRISTSLSEKEREILIHCLIKHCKKETNRMKSLLAFIDHETKDSGDGISRNDILGAVRAGQIQHFGANDNFHTSNKELSGLLGRLWDLGLVKHYTDLRRPSRIKRYVCEKEWEAKLKSLYSI